jgi:hypothetical protein
MVANASPLVLLVTLVDHLPLPPPSGPHRGRPRVYSDRLFLKALVIMVLRQLATVHALLAVLEQPTPEMQRLRRLLMEDGRYPTRRTFERRLAAIPATLPAQIGCLGQHLLARIQPWEQTGRAVAIDSTVVRAFAGAVWHKRDREAGHVPHTAIDTEAHWTKSDWHGWVYGWKLHLVTTVAAVWIPLAAEVTAANVADNVQATRLLPDIPDEARFILGDTHYDDAALQTQAIEREQVIVASRRAGTRPRTDDGAAVRSLFHALRSHAIENFNGQFKAIFDISRPVPTRGLRATRRLLLGAVLVYQLAVLHRHQVGEPLRVGLKPFLQAA